jgi:CysZ protein
LRVQAGVFGLKIFSMVRKLYIGFVAPFIGIRLIFSRRYLFLVSVVPIIVNTLLYALLGLLIYSYYGDIVGLVVRHPETAVGKVLYWAFFAFFMLFVLTFFIFTFTIVGSVLLAPFNSVIAKRTYKILSLSAGARATGGITGGSAGLLGSAYDSIKLELKKLVLIFIPIFALYVLGIFFPPLAVVALFMGFLAVTFEYTDYIMEERNMAIRDRVKMLLSNPVQSLSFGFVASIMVSVPVLGLVCIPSSVAGATMLFIEIEKQ